MEHLTFALWSALAMGAILILLALPRGPRVDRLNLVLEIAMDSLTTQKPQFSIHPTAAGREASVSKLTEVVWSVSDANVATVVETATDHSTSELRPFAPGTVSLTVSAKNQAGVTLTDSTTVTFSEPPVDALNLRNDGATAA